jgi:hypothetical protein
MRIPPEVSERVKEAPAQALRAVFSGIGQVLLVADRIKSRATEPPRSAPRPQSPAAPAKDQTRWRSLDETGNVRLLSEEDKAKDKARDKGTDKGTDKTEAKAKPPAAPPEPEPAAAGEPEAVVAEAAAVVESPAATAETPAAAEPDPAAIAESAASEPAAVAEPPAPPESAASEAVAAPPATTPAAAAPPATTPTAATRPAAAAGALPVPNYDALTVASLRARLRNLDAAQLRVMADYERANADREAVVTMFERRIAKLESGEA